MSTAGESDFHNNVDFDNNAMGQTSAWTFAERVPTVSQFAKGIGFVARLVRMIPRRLRGRARRVSVVWTGTMVMFQCCSSFTILLARQGLAVFETWDCTVA